MAGRHGSSMRVAGVLETCLYVDDLATASRFYQDVLGLEFHSRQQGRHEFFRCGEGMVLLFDARISSDPASNLPPHGATGPGHLAFAIDVRELDAWRRHLQQHGVPIEREVTWPAGATSLYFRDPAGNSLELAPALIWTHHEQPR